MTGWLQLLGNLTLASSAAVLLILVLRCLCGRLPKRYLCWLWLPVFLRAVCPVSFSSPFSLYRLFSGFPGFVTSGGRMTLELAGYQNARLRAILEGVGTGAGMGEHPAAEAFIESGNETALVTLLFVIWGAGVAVLLLYGLISWLRLRKRTALAVQTEPGVRESDRIGSAFLLG